jgi:hypothetical protein
MSDGRTAERMEALILWRERIRRIGYRFNVSTGTLFASDRASMAR